MRTLAVLTVLATSALAPASVAAQRACHVAEWSDGEEIETTDYRFDARGRITRVDFVSDPAAFTVRTTWRYDETGALIERRDRQFEGPVEDRLGLHAPTVVTTERRGLEVIERSDGPFEEDDGVRRTVFDARGLVSSVVLDDGETFRCAYDVEGRPIYRARSGETQSERRFVWSGGRLVRVVASGGGTESVETVRVTGSTLVIRGEDGETRYTGSCDAVMYGACSPAFAPMPPSGQRAQLPSARGAASRPRAAHGDVDAFPSVLSSPLHSARSRPLIRGTSWTAVTFGESDPSFPIAMVCVGAELGGACLTQIHHDDRRVTHVTTRDPTLRAPSGIVVGAAYPSISAQLGTCAIENGLEAGVRCGVRDAPDVVVWLDEVAGATEGTPLTQAMLATRRVVHVDWSAR